MKAPQYRTETRSVTISEVPSTLRIALLQYAEKTKLKMVGATAWVTTRELVPSVTMLGKLFGRQKKPVGPDAVHEMVLVLHETHLLFVTSITTSGAARDTTVHGLPLSAATLTRSEDGLTVSGFPAGDGPTTYLMHLGAGAAAEGCVSAVMAAVDAAKKTAA